MFVVTHGFLNKNCLNCFDANEHLHTISMKLDDTDDSKYNNDRLTNCGITIAQRNDFENYSSYEVSQSNSKKQSAF